MDEAQARLIREELSLRRKRIQFLEAENATRKKRLFNIAETYRLHTSCVNTDWAKVALTMSHIAKE